MPVSLVVQAGPHRGVSSREVARRARAMLRSLGHTPSELSIVLTDDEQIHILNRDYRKKDRPTDVLAFAMSEGEFAEVSGAMLGDVIISVPTAARQAAERDVATLEEVTMLLAHGLLHLLGWDHETAAKDRAMRAETDKLCAAATHPERRSSRSTARPEARSRAGTIAPNSSLKARQVSRQRSK